MTADIDRTLADWFQSDALGTEPADGLAQALAGAHRRRPRPAWLAGPGSHWGWATPRHGPRVSARALVAIAVLVALLGGALVVGARLLVPPTPLPARLGQLAYAAEGDIFLADWEGAKPIRIADGLPGSKSGCGSAGFWAEGPMWSPDGRFLAYRSPRSQVDCDRPAADTYPTILLSDPTGQVVAEVPGVGWLIPWSPDSTRFATWLDLYPSTRIGVYGIDGVRQAELFLPPAVSDNIAGDFDPAWSPDGKSLLIPTQLRSGQMTCSAGGRTCDYPREIWEVPVDGRPPRPVAADDPRSHWLSSRSPDGTQVAYVAKGGDGSAEGTLVVADADGSRPRELFSGRTDQWLNVVAWSPTSDRIAFLAGDKAVEKYAALVDVQQGLRVVDVSSGSVATLVASGDPDLLQLIDFSPEGDRILFARYDAASGLQALWSVDADGSDLRMLVNDVAWGSGGWQSVRADPSSGDARTPSSSVEGP